MSSVFELSWSKNSFFHKLQLFFKSQSREKTKMRSSDPTLQAQGYSALSSTYYSISGSAFSQLKNIWRPAWFILFAPLRVLFWSLTWLPLAAWCYYRMLPLSDKVVSLIGYGRMSPEQCDVRQSILRARRQYGEARKCIEIALSKKIEVPHTRALLHIGLADIYMKDGYRQGKKYWKEVQQNVVAALKIAEQVEKEEPRQAARIYRHSADLADYSEMSILLSGMDLREKAKQLAQAVDAKDQLLKLQ